MNADGQARVDAMRGRVLRDRYVSLEGRSIPGPRAKGGSRYAYIF